MSVVASASLQMSSASNMYEQDYRRELSQKKNTLSQLDTDALNSVQSEMRQRSDTFPFKVSSTTSLSTTMEFADNVSTSGVKVGGKAFLGFTVLLAIVTLYVTGGCGFVRRAFVNGSESDDKNAGDDKINEVERYTTAGSTANSGLGLAAQQGTPQGTLFQLAVIQYFAAVHASPALAVVVYHAMRSSLRDKITSASFAQFNDFWTLGSDALMDGNTFLELCRPNDVRDADAAQIFNYANVDYKKPGNAGGKLNNTEFVSLAFFHFLSTSSSEEMAHVRSVLDSTFVNLDHDGDGVITTGDLAHFNYTNPQHQGELRKDGLEVLFTDAGTLRAIQQINSNPPLGGDHKPVPLAKDA